MLYTFLLTQRATPYIYNGDEIGMSNIRFKNISDYNDLQTRNRYNLELKKSQKAADDYLKMQAELSRDNSRTPMQWNASNLAGFTSGKPWLPINDNKSTVNVEASDKDENSILNFVRKMTKLRKEFKEILVYGKYETQDSKNPDVFSYTRSNGKDTFLIVLNFTKKQCKTSIPEGFILDKELINNLNSLQIVGNTIDLQPYQACVVQLK